jgi:two-component system response regulator HydG
MEPIRALIADDDERIRRLYQTTLESAGHRAEVASSGPEVLEKVQSQPFDLVVVDLYFPPTDGLAVLEGIKRLRPSTLVVLVTGSASVETAVAAFRRGAFDYLVKPVRPEELKEIAARASAVRRLGEERRRLAEALENERLRVQQLERQLDRNDPFRRILGSSRAVRDLVETLREVARTDSTVLIRGESGTGKGLVARIIHDGSSRSGGPFVEANCVVYSEGVLHSELFGHEKGAFTGAARTKRGRFEMAQGGTLFLDEIGEISPATQLLLLRVLQERTFERVGGEQTLEVDVRLIAATNRNLEEAMRTGAFRSDLYYRLNVIPVHLPPLRERPEDIPILAMRFLEESSARVGRPVEGFTPEAMEAMVRYPWPGNVRELQNTIERLVVLSRSERIGFDCLPAQIRGEGQGGGFIGGFTLAELERRRILEVLGDSKGNKKLAARRLGIHRSTLYSKLRKYGMEIGPAEIVPKKRREIGQGGTDLATAGATSRGTER